MYPNSSYHTWAASSESRDDVVTISPTHSAFADGWFYVTVCGFTRADFELVAEAVNLPRQPWASGSYKRRPRTYALARLAAHECFGLHAVLHNTAQDVTVVAVTPCEVYTMKREHFLYHVRGEMLRSIEKLANEQLKVRRGLIEARRRWNATHQDAIPTPSPPSLALTPSRSSSPSVTHRIHGRTMTPSPTRPMSASSLSSSSLRPKRIGGSDYVYERPFSPTRPLTYTPTRQNDIEDNDDNTEVDESLSTALVPYESPKVTFIEDEIEAANAAAEAVQRMHHREFIRPTSAHRRITQQQQQRGGHNLDKNGRPQSAPSRRRLRHDPNAPIPPPPPRSRPTSALVVPTTPTSGGVYATPLMSAATAPSSNGMDDPSLSLQVDLPVSSPRVQASPLSASPTTTGSHHGPPATIAQSPLAMSPSMLRSANAEVSADLRAMRTQSFSHAATLLADQYGYRSSFQQRRMKHIQSTMEKEGKKPSPATTSEHKAPSHHDTNNSSINNGSTNTTASYASKAHVLSDHHPRHRPSLYDSAFADPSLLLLLHSATAAHKQQQVKAAAALSGGPRRADAPRASIPLAAPIVVDPRLLALASPPASNTKRRLMRTPSVQHRSFADALAAATTSTPIRSQSQQAVRGSPRHDSQSSPLLSSTPAPIAQLTSPFSASESLSQSPSTSSLPPSSTPSSNVVPPLPIFGLTQLDSNTSNTHIPRSTSTVQPPSSTIVPPSTSSGINTTPLAVNAPATVATSVASTSSIRVRPQSAGPAKQRSSSLSRRSLSSQKSQKQHIHNHNVSNASIQSGLVVMGQAATTPSRPSSAMSMTTQRAVGMSTSSTAVLQSMLQQSPSRSGSRNGNRGRSTAPSPPPSSSSSQHRRPQSAHVMRHTSSTATPSRSIPVRGVTVISQAPVFADAPPTPSAVVPLVSHGGFESPRRYHGRVADESLPSDVFTRPSSRISIRDFPPLPITSSSHGISIHSTNNDIPPTTSAVTTTIQDGTPVRPSRSPLLHGAFSLNINSSPSPSPSPSRQGYSNDVGSSTMINDSMLASLKQPLEEQKEMDDHDHNSIDGGHDDHDNEDIIDEAGDDNELLRSSSSNRQMHQPNTAADSEGVITSMTPSSSTTPLTSERMRAEARARADDEEQKRVNWKLRGQTIYTPTPMTLMMTTPSVTTIGMVAPDERIFIQSTSSPSKMASSPSVSLQQSLHARLKASAAHLYAASRLGTGSGLVNKSHRSATSRRALATGAKRVQRPASATRTNPTF
jgi:CRP-like cAMP-binding protein